MSRIGFILLSVFCSLFLSLLIGCAHTASLPEPSVNTADSVPSHCPHRPEVDCSLEYRWGDEDFVETLGTRERRDFYHRQLSRVLELDEQGRVMRTYSLELEKPEKGDTGIQRSYYASTGRVRREVFLQNGLREGPERVFYPDGRLKELTHWKLDRRQGPYEERYDNGKRRLLANYESNLLDGKLSVYFDDGMLMQEVNFLSGQKTGLESTFYQNGQPRTRMQYQEGVRQGNAEAFDPYGVTLWRGSYRQGHLDGPFYCFQPDGKTLRQQILYREGDAVSRRYYSPAGQMQLLAQLHPDGSPARYTGETALARTASACRDSIE